MVFQKGVSYTKKKICRFLLCCISLYKDRICSSVLVRKKCEIAYVYMFYAVLVNITNLRLLQLRERYNIK